MEGRQLAAFINLGGQRVPEEFAEPAGAELRPLDVCPALCACDEALLLTPAPRSPCGFIFAEPEVETLVLVSGVVVCALAWPAVKAKAAAVMLARIA